MARYIESENTMTDIVQGSMRIVSLRNNLQLGGVALHGIPKMVKEVIDNNYWRVVEMFVPVQSSIGWERILQTKTFQQFEAFVEDDTFGLNTTLETIKRVCRDNLEALEAIDAVTRGTPGKRPNVEVHEQIRQYKEQHPEASNREVAQATGSSHPTVGKYNPYNIRDILTTTPDYGTSLSYTLRRLKEDHPELYQRVVAGDLSANAAAREAGIRRPTTTIYTDDAASIARTLKKKLDADTLAELIDLLQYGTLTP